MDENLKDTKRKRSFPFVIYHAVMSHQTCVISGLRLEDELFPKELANCPQTALGMGKEDYYVCHVLPIPNLEVVACVLSQVQTAILNKLIKRTTLLLKSRTSRLFMVTTFGR